MKETGLHRGISIALAIMFVIFALLQYNDPDPYYWILIYGGAGGFCLVSLNRPLTWWILALLMLLLVVDAILTWPTNFGEVTADMDLMQPEIETSRESLGKLVTAAAMGYLLWRGLVRSKS